MDVQLCFDTAEHRLGVPLAHDVMLRTLSFCNHTDSRIQFSLTVPRRVPREFAAFCACRILRAHGKYNPALALIPYFALVLDAAPSARAGTEPLGPDEGSNS